MKSFNSTVRALALSALVAAVPSAAVNAGDGQPFSVKPMQAFNLEIGVKRALGYFLANDGQCELTVLVSDMSYPEDNIIPSASRINVKVAAGTSAKIDTIDSRTMAFKCANTANSMTVSVHERLALSPTLLRR